jgi:hypothetical protein
VTVFAPLRAELSRAFTRYFGSKGGFQPTPGQQLLPVVIVDDDLPWPAARKWGISSQIAGLAANNSGVVIRNNDPLDSGSLIIIDSVDALIGVATSDLIFTLHDLGTLIPISGPFNPVDVSPPPPGRASISNVSYAGFQQVPSATTGYRFFGVAGTPSRFGFPLAMPRWTISPQQELGIWCSVVNTQISFTVGGRYYASAS